MARRVPLKAYALGCFAAFLGVSQACAQSMLLNPVRKTLFTDWSGCHIGADGAYTTGSSSWSDIPKLVSLKNHDVNGRALVGVFGCDLQVGPLLAGLEGELAFGNTTKSTTQSGATVVGPNTYPWSAINTSTVSSIASVSGRAGIDLGRILLFAKGGVAAARTKLGFTYTSDPNIPSFLQSNMHDSNWRPGLLLGVGAELAIAAGFSLKAEYDLMNFGTGGGSLMGTALNTSGLSIVSQVYENKMTISRLKAGVNYRF